MKFTRKPIDEGRTVLSYLGWIDDGKMDEDDNLPEDCQLSVKVEWLKGYDFKWLGTQINEFVENETNQITLYFDGQFSTEGI